MSNNSTPTPPTPSQVDPFPPVMDQNLMVHPGLASMDPALFRMLMREKATHVIPTEHLNDLPFPVARSLAPVRKMQGPPQALVAGDNVYRLPYRCVGYSIHNFSTADITRNFDGAASPYNERIPANGGFLSEDAYSLELHIWCSQATNVNGGPLAAGNTPGNTVIIECGVQV